MSWTVQKPIKKLLIHPSGGGGSQGNWGGPISKVREISWTAEKIDKLLFTPPHPYPTGAAFAVTPFFGDITPFSKPGRRFGNYVPSLGRSFTVVNIVGSRPAFRVSSVVIRSVFTNGLSIQTWSPMLSSSHHVQPYDTLGAATVTVPQAAMPTGCGVTVIVAPPSVSSITYLYALIIRARTVALHSRINHNCYQLPA